jgi:type IV pilus assembly protein PilN
MARINLLPWREERRKQRNRETGALFLAVAIAAALVVVGIIMQYNQWIRGQRERNDYLAEEIRQVDARIKEIESIDKERARLLARKQVIEQLQASRSMMVHLFDDLVKTIPDGVRLMTIKQSGDQLTLEGFAESNARVSEYMRNLEASNYVGNPDLRIVEAKGPDKRSRYQFTLGVMLKRPKAEGEGQQGTEGAAPLAQGGTP